MEQKGHRLRELAEKMVGVGRKKTLPFLLGLLTWADPLRNRNGPEKRITGNCI